MELVIASNNRNKIREIKEILGDFFEKVSALSELGIDIDVEETGTTFAENAELKARTICGITGMCAIADDSGLCVNALGGAPGLYSARYAGEEHDDEKNKRLLLENMKGITDRTAYFVTVIALCYPDGRTVFAEGRTEGEILTEEHGTNGFGYDPLFYSYDIEECFGTATAEVKNSVSHRGRALRLLEQKLKNNN